MQKKFLTNLGLMLFLNLLIKPFWIFGIDRSVQNLVGVSAYGYYSAILNFSFLFSILLDFGITNYNNRNIAQHKHLLNKHLSGIVMLRFLLAMVYFIIIMTSGAIIGYSTEQLQLLAVVGFNQFLLTFVLYLRSNISGLLLFKTDSFVSVLDRLLMILFVGFLLMNNYTRTHFQIQWFVYAQTLAYLLTGVFAGVAVLRKSSFVRLSWNIPFFIMIIKQSFPFALLTLLMSFYNRIDFVLLERLLPGKLGDEQSGIYALAFRLLDAANMFAFLFAALLLPIFANMLKNKQSVIGIVKLAFNILWVISIFSASISLFNAQEIMHVLYPQHIDESAIAFAERLAESSLIFKLLMTAFVAMSSSYVFGTLLTAHGSLKLLNITAFSCMVINILLNLILIPRMEAVGAAITNLISQAVSILIQIVIVIHIFKLQPDWKYLLKLAFFVFIVFAICFVVQMLGLNIFWNIVLAGMLTILTAVGLKLFNINNLILLLRKDQQ
jgi:O-antigen/teichoic acid export membrane protein